MGFKVAAGRVDIGCSGLVDLIWRAFDVFPPHITGPDWIIGPGSPRFDIAAKLPQGATEEQIPAMLQALLVDRFKLAYHLETKEQPGYGLVVAKGGLKLTEAAPNAAASNRSNSRPESPPACNRQDEHRRHLVHRNANSQ